MAGLLFLGLDETGDWRAEGEANPVVWTQTGMNIQWPKKYDMVTVKNQRQRLGRYQSIGSIHTTELVIYCYFIYLETLVEE